MSGYGVLRVVLFLQILSAFVSSEPFKNEVDQQDDEKFRFKYHFSIPEFWTNDPNGMVYLDGEYHLHYQYNPFAAIGEGSQMHWGHAVSKDLVTWTILPIALYPDQLGAIWSGSAVADLGNSSGLQTGNNTTIVAIFTHFGPAQQQSIAFSNDLGRTYTKFAGNPVIPNPEGAMPDFRDPKVIRYGDSWVMVLAAGPKIQFYGSDDLKSWELLSQFGENPDQGVKEGPWECPDFLKMRFGNLWKWVLIVSLYGGSKSPNGGSTTQYFVGDFDGKTFRTSQLTPLWLDWGVDNYAGVTFDNDPKGRNVMMSWMTNLDYGGSTPTNSWRGQMTLPRVLDLVLVNGQLRLRSTIAEELDALKKPNEMLQFTNTAIVAAGNVTLTGGANWTNPLMVVDLTFNMSGLDSTGSISVCIINSFDQEICLDELEKLGSFEGHADDHLTLLSLTRESVFIGARDALYNFSLKNDLIPYSAVNWTASPEHQEQCQIKGQAESKCHNFLRVFHGPVVNHQSYSKAEFLSSALINSGSSLPTLQAAESQFLVCGTNAFKPTCRWYSPDLNQFSREFSGVGYSPFDPTHASTSVLHHDSVYAATVADFGGADSLIYKQPLRTEQYFDLHLNSPSFVSSLSFGDLALFFFREAAVEHSNCGKAVFSRVARICRHDGGSRKHKDRFTTFLKARLNCSIPGEFPFYFDHIQGTTDIFMNNERREEMLYAVFKTPPNSIGASAVCSFYTKDILKAFEGPFKGQSSIDANWLPVPNNEVPKPRPGQCSNDPTQQPDSNSVAFLKSHPLMDEAVQGTAVITVTSSTDSFTSVAVDHSPEVAPYHIIYVGTDSGKVYKGVVNASDTNFIEPFSKYSPEVSVISQSWDVFPGQSIKSIRLLDSRRLLVLTENQMSVVAIDNCDKFSNCGKCLSIRDPHCGWDKTESRCVAKNPRIPHKERDQIFLQDVSAGDMHLCPIDDHTNEIIEANPLKSINEEDAKKKEECCACSSTTSTTTSSSSTSPSKKGTPPSRSSSGDSDYFDGELSVDEDQRIVIQAQQNQSFHDNEIPRLGRNYNGQDFESSYVRSGEGLVSSQSVILATTSSAVLSLLVGFTLGFLVSKWISTRQTKSQTSTNAQLTATLNESQRLTKSIDFVVNVPTAASKNPMKNNFNNTDTLEKTVKKIYL